MKLVIFGATSAIAIAVARLYAKRGATFHLVARNSERLDALKKDLLVRGATAVTTALADLTDIRNHASLVADARERIGDIDLALSCYGDLPSQSDCEGDVETLLQSFAVNATSALALLTELAKVFEAQKKGQLAVITSVAGDRGRRSNYAYGASKAAVSTFVEGLRGRLHSRGVSVIDIRPGLVDTPMTAHLPKGPLFSSPEKVADRIVHGIDKNRSLIYAPGYWRWVMLAVRLIPTRLFRHLKF